MFVAVVVVGWGNILFSMTRYTATATATTAPFKDLWMHWSVQISCNEMVFGTSRVLLWGGRGCHILLPPTGGNTGGDLPNRPQVDVQLRDAAAPMVHSAPRG